jgi:molybdenum cofactor cytidylyltransferase
MRIAAIIPAAGESARFAGVNKLLLPIGGVPMIRLVASTVLEAELEPVFVIANPDVQEMTEALDGLPVNIIINPDPTAGMASSLVTGIHALPNNIDGLLIMLADMPLLQSSTLLALAARFKESDAAKIVYPTNAGQQGNPVIFPKRYFRKIEALKGDRGAKALLKDYASNCIPVPVDSDSILIDIDTDADYNRVCRILETNG